MLSSVTLQKGRGLREPTAAPKLGAMALGQHFNDWCVSALQYRVGLTGITVISQWVTEVVLMWT